MTDPRSKHGLPPVARRPLAENECECRIDGCTAIHKRHLFACRLHWHALPGRYKRAIWSAYRSRGVFSQEYLQAAENAEAYLEARDAVDLFADTPAQIARRARRSRKLRDQAELDADEEILDALTELK